MSGAGARHADLPDDSAAGGANGQPAGIRRVEIRGIRRGRHFSGPDWVADEVPIALAYNGIAHAVMLGTPLDLEDFAVGFSLAEGIVDSARQVYGVEWAESAHGIAVDVEIAAEAFMGLKSRRRSLAGRTGCGLCGTEQLSQVERPIAPLSPGASPGVTPAAIATALTRLRDAQRLQALCGAVHAACWCGPDGEPQFVREDVGRHNALDKLTGALIRAGRDAGDGFIAVTSRASFEMVQKTALAGCGLLVAVSAPTAYAIRIAEAAALTLVGFARGEDLVVYSHPGRIAGLDDAAGEAAGGPGIA